MNSKTAFGSAIAAILISFLTTLAVGSVQTTTTTTTEKPAQIVVVADGTGDNGGLEWG
jgi:hypothetical protein